MTQSPTGRRIVLLNRFYWPDVAATAQMLTDLAEDLATRGWAVTVVTSDTAYEGTSGNLPSHDVRNGVRIFRTSGTRFGRDRLAGRLSDYLSYMAGAFARLMRLEPHDVVVGMSDPPFIVGVAVLTAKLRRWKSVYWVQDLFPQLAGALGVLPAGTLAYRVADRMARWLNRRADLVVALGPRMAERMVEAGATPGRVVHVHNWADATAIQPVPPGENAFLAEHGLEGRFVVLYSGNAGRAHTFHSVMEAARQLRDDSDVVFLFVGGGKATAQLQKLTARERLGNVRFLDYVPRASLASSLSAASVSLVTEREEVCGLLVPSKTYAVLASGRPVIYVGPEHSDAARIVRAAECGVVIGIGDADTLVQTIQQLRTDVAASAALGARGRAAAESLYDRRLATAHWERAVLSLLATD